MRGYDDWKTRTPPSPGEDDTEPELDPVEAGLEELEAAAAREHWAESLIQQAAFMHIRFDSNCRGYTMASSGRAFCGSCQWEMSARLSDVGQARSGRFALFVLAVIGETFARADREVPLPVAQDYLARGEWPLVMYSDGTWFVGPARNHG